MTEEYERFTHSRETLSKRPTGHSLANDSMETGYYRRRMGEPSEIIENEYYQVDLEDTRVLRVRRHWYRATIDRRYWYGDGYL